MRVRCSACGAEYETAVTAAALALVGRCERCGRQRLRRADADPADDEAERVGVEPHGCGGNGPLS